MAGATLLIDYPGGGSIVEWSESVHAMMDEFDFDTVIPGHGAVTTPDGLVSYRDGVVAMRAIAAELVQEGGSQEEVREAIAEDYPACVPDSLYDQWTRPYGEELR